MIVTTERRHWWARDGSIDWLCLPDFDSPFIFGPRSIMPRGGFRLSPRGEVRGEQAYVDDTNLLATRMLGNFPLLFAQIELVRAALWVCARISSTASGRWP